MIVFEGLPRQHFGAILADPPWRFKVWNGADKRVASRGSVTPYNTMEIDEICSMPIEAICAPDCVLFLWVTWPVLNDGLRVMESWGFQYKTCAFNWTKAHAGQVEMFQDDIETYMGLGYWTRANTEPCLLGTRGKPKRLDAGVRQAIIAPKREHSRKPDGVHASIQRLVAGPYLELFARQQRQGWTTWGNQTDRFAPAQQSPSETLVNQ